jgi:hypothetical protein
MESDLNTVCRAENEYLRRTKQVVQTKIQWTKIPKKAKIELKIQN